MTIAKTNILNILYLFKLYLTNLKTYRHSDIHPLPENFPYVFDQLN